jgi:hypothetical protein
MVGDGPGPVEVKLSVEGSEGGAADRAGHRRPWFLTPWASVVVLAVVYLPLAVTFSLLTRAYEADDEQAHTQYIEYIVRHDAIPHISVANLQESHQPPLYYLLAAGWQEVLGIPAFTPVTTPEHYKNPFIQNRLVLSHDYTTSQHREAVYLHELRLLSVLLGLGTVLLAYAGAKVAGLRESMALSAGLFVAILPRELVVSSAVTNDALVIPLCALALVLFLLSERARRTGRRGHRRLHLTGMGLALGAAAATKFNSLPVAAVLMVLALVPMIRWPERSSARPLSDESGNDPVVATGGSGGRPRIGVDGGVVVDGVIAIVSFFALSGWWFIRNKHLYGQYLAGKASENYLTHYLLHPLSWHSDLFAQVFFRTFFVSTWYSQPNLLLPDWMDRILAIMALVCLAAGIVSLFVGGRGDSSRVPSLSGLAFVGCVAAGIVAVSITIGSTSIGDARVAFVGLTAFAAVVTVGSVRLLGLLHHRLEPVGLLLWPAALMDVDIYVLVRFLIPLGGL